MSNQLSPAQSLPAEVLRPIFTWITQEHKSILYGDSSQMHYVKELLTVCSAWRQMALECLWRELGLNIYTGHKEVKLSRPKWVKGNELPLNSASLVREVHVRVPMPSIVGGGAHRLLGNYFGDTKCLPLADKLTVEITDFNSEYSLAEEAVLNNARGFATLVKTLAPAATAVNVEYDIVSPIKWYEEQEYVKEMDEKVVALLADKLYAGTKRAGFDVNSIDIHKLSTINYIPPLAKLRLTRNVSTDVVSRLLCQSACALQHLELDVRDAKTLIYDTSGNAIVFPKLDYLRLSAKHCSDYSLNSGAGDVVLFPVLRVLRMHMSYPFHDDILLRGNAETLEYLYLCVDNDAIATLGQMQAFEGSHRVLRYVYINWPSFNRNTTSESDGGTYRFLNRLVNVVEKLIVLSMREAWGCIAAAQHGQGFQNIKEFSLDTGTMSLFEMLSVLKAFPGLVKLTNTINGLGLELEDIAADELPDYVDSVFGNVGKHLQVWSMLFVSGYMGVKMIDYVALLMLVCPELCRAHMNGGSGEGVRAKIAEVQSSQRFSKYKLRLDKLLEAVRE